MKSLVILIIVSLGTILNNSCDAYEYLYDQDDSDFKWLYDNQLYGNGFGNNAFNGDFDDYVPSSYHKSVHYPPIISYHPSSYYYNSRSQLDDQWNEVPPLYLTYKTLPRVQEKPVFFAPPPPPLSTDQPPSTDGYRYPVPQSSYLPPQSSYLPPSRRPITFPQTRKPDVPKSFYIPPTTVYVPHTTKATPKTTVYVPHTRKPTTAIPNTTVTTTTTAKPSTPNSLYLPPIVVPEPVDSQYLPPPPELAPHLQPPAISRAKPISFH